MPKTSQDWRILLDTIGGRRFLLTCAAGIASCTLVWFGKITSDAWAMVQLGTVAAYITGASYEAVKKGQSE